MSALPPTPGRGRSRFSKALPSTPPAVPERRPKSPAASSLNKSLHSALPSLPKAKITMSIPRKAVGANAVQSVPNALPRDQHQDQEPEEASATRDSLSSIYSNYPGFRDSDDGEGITDDWNGTDVGTPPSLPPKDDHSISDPSNIIGSQQSGFETSPPKPEIWRRRSVKSDRSITFPEIKIEKSNGATNAPTLPPDRDLPQLPAQLPRSVTGRKPIPQRAAPPQPQDPMGSKLSKLKNKRSKGDHDSFMSDGDSQTQSRPTQPTQNRLPTPEYRKTDRQQPLTPQVLSPLSPETPPQDVITPPELPRKSESRNGFKQSEVQHQSNNKPNFLSHTRELSETLTINSEPHVMRSPQPKKAYASRILTPEPASPDITSPLALPSPAGVKAIDIKFPTMPGGPLTANTIVDGPPLEMQHFECYQAHKFMRNSKNNLCPVACMVCKKKDAEARWKCTWCCLRSCATCMQVLHSVPNKDLRLCLEKVEKIGIMA